MHILEYSQKLPLSKEQAWEFFSSPVNLQTITPEYLSFQITSRVPDRIYPGLIITYLVRPFLRLPLEWVTEITYVDDYSYFVDEQRFGPYTFWHHKHFFRETPGGVIVEDIVHYKLPFGFIGKIVNHLFVRRQLAGIFEYRTQKLNELFGSMNKD